MLNASIVYILWLVCLTAKTLAFSSNTNATLLVGLGSHCEVAAHLREANLRDIAYPFDWLISYDHKCFISLLNTDFEYFFDRGYYFQHPQHIYTLVNSKYKIKFRHDWPFQDLYHDSNRYEVQLNELFSKYSRRISRFRNLNNYPGKVYFIRTAFDFPKHPSFYWGENDVSIITNEQALELEVALREYFPSLNFTLVIVNYFEKSTQPIESINNVVEFRLKKSNIHEDYKNMFNVLMAGLH